MPVFSNQKHQVSDAVPILIVESNASEWLLIRAALAQCFPEVAPHWTSTAAQAMTYLQTAAGDKSKLPALIIVDYHPQQQEHWFFLRAIKNNPLYQHIPVIFLSSSQAPIDIDQAYNLGAASYIVKPTTYHFWVRCFMGFRNYWWNLVTIPTYKG